MIEGLRRKDNMKDNLKDKAMIGKAIYRISEIPEGIEYTDECWVKIYKARSAYDSVKLKLKVTMWIRSRVTT